MKMSHSEAGRLGAEKSKQTTTLKKQERIGLYDKNPSFCKNCVCPLPYLKRKNNFCGQSCAATFNNTIYPKRNRSKLNCKSCSKQLKGRNYDYCDNVCQKDFEWAERKKFIESTGIEKSSRMTKRYFIEIRGNRCEICNLESEWNGKPIVLILDHIDGNSENNFISNQRLVCPNCDSQLPTFKGRNMGHGRHSRKIRYQEGKSF